MKFQIAILASLLPVAASDFRQGYTVDTSVNATSSSFGGTICSKGYPGGFADSVYESTHMFYFGVDCWLSNGQPSAIFIDGLGGVINLSCFYYLMYVYRHKVGYSPYLRDFALAQLWQGIAETLGVVMHTMVYIGSSYENAADVPGWVYFFGRWCNGFQFYGAALSGVGLFLLCLRLLLEPSCLKYCKATCVGKFWDRAHAVCLAYVIIGNLAGQIVYGSSYFPMSIHTFLWDFGKYGLYFYGFGQCNVFAVLAAWAFPPWYPALWPAWVPDFPVYEISWQYFNIEAFSDATQDLGNVFLFLATLQCLNSERFKLPASPYYPLLM